ncbi:AzlC family ABC transporter permease [Acuticoccus sp. MNP-M23]|uniref:AzlC family ABC transporter permease n=1 Tax=Acuticoccus sp. MNP-M23 TaxID=3072793 RepID=UPI002814E29E|nr:AzlC family ABC transporter permease [Acuticoccus sp. MNP-M23]WMS42447.1 AzlC family ABC transporter permease [Acuticoccus sp. MNP-M23]
MQQHTPSRSAAAEARAGFLMILPLLGAVTPFALVFGTLAAQKGMTVADATLMSLTFFAGASQMAAVELLGTNVPMWTILLSVLAVNFRHLLYSASLTPIISGQPAWAKALVFLLLVDPQFALTEKRAEEGKPFSLAWYLGLGLPMYFIWVALTAAGAFAGRLIAHPEALGIDMLLPIYFVGLVMGFRKRARWGLVVLTSGAVSLLVYNAPQMGIEWLGAPWHVTIGGLAGVAAAAIWPPAGPHRSMLRVAEGEYVPAMGAEEPAHDR